MITKPLLKSLSVLTAALLFTASAGCRIERRTTPEPAAEPAPPPPGAGPSQESAPPLPPDSQPPGKKGSAASSSPPPPPPPAPSAGSAAPPPARPSPPAAAPGAGRFPRKMGLPRLWVKKIYLKKVSLRKIKLRAICRVFNPLAFRTPAFSFHYTLWINGVRVSRGRAKIRSVGPKVSTNAAVDVTLGPRAAVKVARRLLRGRRRYHIKGFLTGRIGKRVIRIPVEKKGNLVR